MFSPELDGPVTQEGPNSCYDNLLFDQADQQHSFPTAASSRDTRAVLSCVGKGLTCTSTSGSACSYDDPNGGDEKRDNDHGTGFFDNNQMIRDCDKLIETFLVDKPALADWRRLLVFNKKWSNIRLHFFRHCQDRADSGDILLMKNKLLWLGKKLKEVPHLLLKFILISITTLCHYATGDQCKTS